MENVRDVKGLKEELEEQGVLWCLFYGLIADEASKKGWAFKVIHDVIFELNKVGLYDYGTFMKGQDGELELKTGVLTFLRNLPQPPQPIRMYSFNVAYKNKKGTVSRKSFEVDKEHLRVDFLVSKITSIFSTNNARLRVTINEDELSEDTVRKYAASPERKHELFAENLQKGFNSFQNIEDALRLVGKNAKIVKDVDFFAAPHDLSGCDEEIDLAHKVIEVTSHIVSLTGACEATKRIFIDPILVAAARIVKEFQMDVERRIESPDADGPVDYIFKHVDRIVCVTEGKYEKQDSGVSQNLAQLVAVRELSKKRKFEQISKGEDLPLFGIATTYVEWQFLELQGETVRITKRYPCHGLNKQSVSNIIAMVAALLRDGKKSDGKEEENEEVAK